MFLETQEKRAPKGRKAFWRLGFLGTPGGIPTCHLCPQGREAGMLNRKVFAPRIKMEW